jgi:hypothetical protein
LPELSAPAAGHVKAFRTTVTVQFGRVVVHPVAVPASTSPGLSTLKDGASAVTTSVTVQVSTGRPVAWIVDETSPLYVKAAIAGVQAIAGLVQAARTAAVARAPRRDRFKDIVLLSECGPADGPPAAIASGAL